MDFIVGQGHKNSNQDDRIIYAMCPTCREKEAILLRDWLIWARMKGKIEDLHYPPPARGRYKLVDFLLDGLKKENGDYLFTIDDVCKKHMIPQRNK